jgi:transcriptional regulator with GAF, ATPase, and Fis domain
VTKGESGTSKALVVHAIHYNILRSAKPFSNVNCTDLPESVIESRPFEHEKGAFTGAGSNGGAIYPDQLQRMGL